MEGIDMKDLLKLAALQLITAITVYLLLFLLRGLPAFVGWLIILAAIAFVLSRKRNIRYPWWCQKMKYMLQRILPRFDGR